MRRVIFSEECGENCTALTSEGALGVRDAGNAPSWRDCAKARMSPRDAARMTTRSVKVRDRSGLVWDGPRETRVY